MANYCKRLIEVDLPIKVISQHARRDQNIRKGHLHRMHVWWATRPLAACRAVLMATLLPDPVDKGCPESFRQEAQEALSWFGGRDLSDNETLRKELLRFIGHFADWDAGINPRFVETARRLVQAAHPDGPPLVVDPFAGIGSIPFEALRIGADAFASDYNPVATLLLRTALDYLPRYGRRLAEEVRRWGQWVRERAKDELQQFYPTEPDGSIPLAYTWARTIRCEGPACGAEVPLVGLLWLSRKAKQRAALRYRADREEKRVLFEIFEPKAESEVQASIVRRFAATCPICSYTTPYKRVREQLRAKGGGTRDARLIAVITLKQNGKRGFRIATEEDLQVARRASEALKRLRAAHDGPVSLVPDEPFPSWYSGVFNPGLWNIRTWGDLFTQRQALALSVFARVLRECHQHVLAEADAAFARAVATCLAIGVSRMSTYMADTCFYHPTFGMQQPFLGSGMPMKPDFADANPLIPKLAGGYEYSLKQICQVLEREGSQGCRSGTVQQGTATAIPLPDQSALYVITDPPYYAAVPYADLSDFLYVWLKRMVGQLHPDLFRTRLSPKNDEIIAYYVQPPDRQQKDERFFEQRMTEALAECRRVLQPGGLAVVLFAHKGTAGWEALLNALVRAGWTVTASWPVETERATRWRARGSAVLASSVFLVCRPRTADAGVGEWRHVLAGLNRRVAEWLLRLAQEGIQGADAIFSCIGPALEVYSRYDRVETAGGQVIPLGDVRNGRGEVVQRGYLSHIWEAVAREALKVIFEEADPTGFEQDARFTAMWLWSVRSRINGPVSRRRQEEETPRVSSHTLPYDDARLIIQGLGTHEEHLKRPGGVLEVKGGKARLLAVADRRRFLIGKDAAMPRRRRREQGMQLALEGMKQVPEGESAIQVARSALDRVHQAMLLFGEGRSEALRRLLVDDGVGRDERFWRLANALSALYLPSSQEKRWVDGVLARKKGLGF